MTTLTNEEINFIYEALSYEVDYFENDSEINTDEYQLILEMMDQNNYNFTPEQKSIIVSLLELEENEELDCIIEKLS